jgi:hypothetical protein
MYMMLVDAPLPLIFNQAKKTLGSPVYRRRP